jgi:hypothetical protein
MEAVNASEPSTLEEALAGRAWEDCVAGAYYVRILLWFFRHPMSIFRKIKPNYPGRSSHVR